jgi:hypothetical protein
MSESHALNRFDRAMAALADPKNEPLRWLLGDVLHQHASALVRIAPPLLCRTDPGILI